MMEFLLHNPLAEMYGPLFLMVYASVIVVTLGLCYAFTHQNNENERILPSIPTNPDPYKIAYLRGGENEILRLAIFNLLRLGYLQLEGNSAKRLTRVQETSVFDLNAVEREALDYYDRPRAPESIFTSSVAGRVKGQCAGYHAQLDAEGLLSSDAIRQRNFQIGARGALIILGLGAYKLIAAVSNGHSNVGFLVLMGIFSLLPLTVVCQTPRLSAQGRRYLQRLQIAYAGLKPSVPLKAQTQSQGDYPYKTSVQSRETQNQEAQYETDMTLAVAVYGVSALSATEYTPVQQMFQQSASATTAGCGSVSSCGSSGGGCGGGGSSCGGGGGCGGCGGGS